MSQTNFAPPETTRTDVQIGLVFEDRRTGDLRRVVYADALVVLVRDETESTTLIDRDSFEAELGTRYRRRPDGDPDVDGGQYDSLRDALATYECREGRKARHKADALREALDLLAGRADAGPSDTGDSSDDDADGTASDNSHGDDAVDAEAAESEVPFEDVPGIGPETAGKLRMQGLVTADDVCAASDEVILAVSGVGPTNLANIREFVD